MKEGTLMKTLLLLTALAMPIAALAETITCEATRQDNIKVELNIEVYERGTITYLDPSLGRIGTQGVEKNLLRDPDGTALHFVTEEKPHKRVLSFESGVFQGQGKALYTPLKLEMNCQLSGEPADVLKKPDPITCTDKKYIEVLFKGIETGNVRDVEEALTCGAGPNDKNEKGCTAFLYATDLRCGDYLPQKILGDKDGRWIYGAQTPGVTNPTSPALAEILDLMISRGALLNARDPKNNETPLIKLVRNSGDSGVIASFIQNEPDMDAQDLEGNTALMWATTLSTISAEAFSAIMELSLGNADRTVKNKDTHTAYAIAKGLGLDEKSRNFDRQYDKRILRELKPASRTVVVRGQNGACTPLQIELREGEAVEFRLESKDKMYLMKAPRLSLEIMAMGGESARLVLTASQRGIFDFTCGIHGAANQSKGTINIK